MLLKELSSGSDGIILFWFILLPLLLCLGVLVVLRNFSMLALEALSFSCLS